MAISEGEPLRILESEGWVARKLEAGGSRAGGGGRVVRQEWVTASWPIPLASQGDLFAAPRCDVVDASEVDLVG